MGNVKGKPWVLAQEWDGSTVTDFFNGAIDELAIHDHVLTTTEMNDIYTNGIKVSPKASIEYSYDNGGNILSKKEYDTSGALVSTINYSYGDSNWKDKLTSYNGKAITYDEIGNPLTYDGYTFTWEMGRQLKSLSGNGKTISYKYNDSGIRTEKTVNGVTTKYILNGDNVIYEDNGTDKIHYSYGGNGLVSLNINGTEYYYVRNAQGDIIAIIDSNGTEVVKYSYNTWGKLISIEGSLKDTVGVKNPYRYRGYRYDTETGLYYLNSRYYNPEWGRFINADGIVAATGELLTGNMYAYCINNPVNLYDPTGQFPFALPYFIPVIINALVIVGKAIVATVATVATLGLAKATSTAISNVKNNTDSSKSKSKSSSSKKNNLPQQGVVSKVPEAPPVDAGKQGKHVPGHNNFNPKKSQWPEGTDGVGLTQEGWINGEVLPDGTKVWDTGRVIGPNGETGVRVHINAKGNIHGYPVDPGQYLR